MPLPGSIRKLLRTEQHLYLDHLLRLDEDARRRRFAHTVSDEFIQRHSQKAADRGSIIFGYFDAGHLRGVAELKLSSGFSNPSAEAAFSVERAHVNQGIATELMGRVIRSARNRGVRHLILACLAENAKMRAIAIKYGAELHFEEGGVVGDIIPSRPNYFSLASEAFDDRLGLLLARLDLGERIKNGGVENFD